MVPEVSNQGRLGKSAAFAVTHSVDSYWALNHIELLSGSVTEVTDCCTRNEVVTIDEIFDCIVRIGGIATSESYPKNVSGKCLSEAYKPSIMIYGHREVDHFDEKALAMAVATTPVVVLVDGSRPSFQEYSSGVYSDDKCTRTELDHTLLVVGYGTMDGKDYWICQNTWGKVLPMIPPTPLSFPPTYCTHCTSLLLPPQGMLGEYGGQ